MKELLLFTILSVFITGHLNCQIATAFGSPIKWDKYFDRTDYMMRGLDTLSKDSILISQESYIRQNQQGSILEELIFAELNSISCNDEGPELTGYWKSYYESGEIKEIGNFICNRKYGTWLYFYKSGQLKKYERYDGLQIIGSNPDVGYLNGAYLEYHQNGNIKVSGTYRIIEENDSIYLFNMETYEEEIECCEWRPKSVKIGKWYTYDNTGEIINTQEYELSVGDSVSSREIGDRFFELNINDLHKN